MAENKAAAYWHIRAAEAASIAEIAGSAEDNLDLLRIAAIFDRMANRARRQATRDEEGKPE